MDSKTLKIGYIGAGNFSNKYIFPQLRYHDIELCAICDKDKVKALMVQKEFGFQRVYTDYEVMYEKESFDAVILIAGMDAHYFVGMQLLDRGIPLEALLSIERPLWMVINP